MRRTKQVLDDLAGNDRVSTFSDVEKRALDVRRVIRKCGFHARRRYHSILAARNADVIRPVCYFFCRNGRANRESSFVNERRSHYPRMSPEFNDTFRPKLAEGGECERDSPAMKPAILRRVNAL